MLTDAEAKSRWCPFALVQSETQECEFEGEWKDRGEGNALLEIFKTQGKMVAVTVINRTIDGAKHPDCLCITSKCVFWRTLEGTKGDCSKLDDNMNNRDQDSDPVMTKQWCPHARPENEPVKGEWTGNGISGCTVAMSSANRQPGGQPHPGSLCIAGQCMAYSTDGLGQGYCMSADKNMQR